MTPVFGCHIAKELAGVTKQGYVTDATITRSPQKMFVNYDREFEEKARPLSDVVENVPGFAAVLIYKLLMELGEARGVPWEDLMYLVTEAKCDQLKEPAKDLVASVAGPDIAVFVNSTGK
jgi:hypothetical protein